MRLYRKGCDRMGGDCKETQPRPFWVINPIILKYSKKYILGTNHNSIELFFWLCNMRIYIDGFVDRNLSGTTIYNKKIYQLEQISAGDSIILTQDINVPLSLAAAICYDPIIINPEINKTDVYIYGAGMVGKKLLAYLNAHGIEVRGFMDSDQTKTSFDVMGKRIYGREFLISLDPEAAVIEAGKYYQEIDSIICGLNKAVHRYFCKSMNEEYVDAIWVDDNISFDGVKFIDGDFCKKKIYLCGKNHALAVKYLEIFKLLDIEDIHIAKWAETVAGQEVCCIEDALLEENAVIVFCETINKDDLKRLHELGLERGKDFCEIRCNIWEKCQGIQMLDINLAFTREMSGEYPGLAVFGANRRDDYKIAILGGSTATSGYYRFKSWPEILYERYCGDNMTVINGAVESYTSAQELIKLMRDIVCLKPDLVLVYDGNNDVIRDESRSIFEIPYMKTIMEYASGKVEIKENENGSRKLFCGVSPAENAVEAWLHNIEYMHAICEQDKIKFVSFMQPMLFSKTVMSSKREEVVKKKWSFLFSRCNGDKMELQTRVFREKASEICRTHDYIYDLSHIFDGEDVYIDHCHVFEHGNEIIAREIYNIIKELM